MFLYLIEILLKNLQQALQNWASIPMVTLHYFRAYSRNKIIPVTIAYKPKVL
jgi:hypothetical protein